jgi:methylenetetrahydrofolate dehydrogenase (NADP+) / methenyltetrahydrofolate cyclohydrolase
VNGLCDKHGISPGLAVILVGRNPASQLYVSNKVRACEEIGIRSERIEFPADVDEARLLAEIDRLNGDVKTHGILVQLPQVHP